MTHRIPLRLLLAGLILTCTVPVNRTASAQPNPANVLMKVEAWVAQNQWTTALHELRQSKIPDEAKLQWLEQKAEEGSGAAQFELAATLHPRDLETSLKWYARAVLSSALDAASCTQPMRYHVMLDRVEPVRTDGIEQPDLLERAIDDAMARPDAMKPTKWSGWVCSARDRLSGETEAASRLEAMKDMAIETKSFKLFAEAARRGREGNFSITDTGLTLDENWPRDKGAWIDDGKVAFVASESGLTPIAHRDQEVFVWDNSKKSFQNITPAEMKANRLCAHRHEITVSLLKRGESDSDKAAYELKGVYPRLVVVPRATPWYGRSFSSQGPPGCNSSVLPPPGIDRNDVRFLAPEHGYIEAVRDPNSRRTTSTLVRPNGSRVPLADLFISDASNVLGFARWNNEYLLQGTWDAERSTFTNRFRRRGEGAVLIWLRPDGVTRKELIPYGYWDQSQPPSSEYFPSRAGVLGVGRRYERDDRAGFAGLFLFENPVRVTRLLSGIVDVLDADPSGCRVAVGHRQTASQRRAQIKIVELCRGVT